MCYYVTPAHNSHVCSDVHESLNEHCLPAGLDISAAGELGDAATWETREGEEDSVQVCALPPHIGVDKEWCE